MHIHDAELAALFHHEPIFRHKTTRVPEIAPTSLFQAPNAGTWAIKYDEYLKSQHGSCESHKSAGQLTSQSQSHSRHLMTAHVPRQSRSMLNSWAVLSGIGATICELRYSNVFSQDHISGLQTDLLCWYTSRNCCSTEPCGSGKESDLPFCLRPLWHYTFMTLAADIDLLEVAVGRDGTNISEAVLDSVKSWMASPDSKRCLLHALFLQNLLKSSTVDSTAAIHTPRIIFTAALCWYCFTLYLPWYTASMDPDSPSISDGTVEYLQGLPEIQLLGDNANAAGRKLVDSTVAEFKRILGANAADMKASTLCAFGSTLRRLTTSGITQRLLELIQVFITGEM